MSLIREQLLALVDQYGVLALFVSITLETLGLPLPGESVMIASAAAAGAGKLSIVHVAVAAYLAAVLGDNIGYLIGRRYGKAVILRYGDRFGITGEKYARVEAVTAKYGPLMVVAARFIVLLRQLNGLAAGTAGMHWALFLGANLVGAALWVGFWVTLAYQFGHNISIVPWLWNHLSLVAMFAIPALLIVIGLLYRRRRGR